jgi:hypothetical protein
VEIFQGFTFNRTCNCLPRNVEVWKELLSIENDPMEALPFHEIGAPYLTLSSEGPWDPSAPVSNEEEEEEEEDTQDTQENHFSPGRNILQSDYVSLTSTFSMKSAQEKSDKKSFHRSKDSKRREFTEELRLGASGAKSPVSLDDLQGEVRVFFLVLSILSQFQLLSRYKAEDGCLRPSQGWLKIPQALFVG